MTANTEIHSLLQDLAALGEEQNLGPVMVERIKRAREGVGETENDWDDGWTDEDMAVVGHSLMAELKRNEASLKGWICCDSPVEIVVDLINARDELQEELDALKASTPPALDTAARVGDDARTVIQNLEHLISFYTERPHVDQDQKIPGMCEMSRRECGDLIGYLRKASRLIERLASIPTPTGRAEALEEAEKVLQEHARSYGAIDTGRTTDQRSRDYACEKALLTAAEAIRALSSAPTQAVTVDDAAVEAGAEALYLLDPLFDLENKAVPVPWHVVKTHHKDEFHELMRTSRTVLAAFPQRPVDDAPRYSYARSSGVWAVWDRSTTTCIKQCADENEAEKLCNKLNKQRREE